MEFKSGDKIIEEIVNSFYEEMSFELSNRFEFENFMPPFDRLKDWHFLRVLATNQT